MVSERAKIALQNWITYGEFFAANLESPSVLHQGVSGILNTVREWQESLYSEAEKLLRKNMEIKWGENYLEYSFQDEEDQKFIVKFQDQEFNEVPELRMEFPTYDEAKQAAIKKFNEIADFKKTGTREAKGIWVVEVVRQIDDHMAETMLYIQLFRRDIEDAD